MFGASNVDTNITLGPTATGIGGDGLNVGHGGNTFRAGISFLDAHSAASNAKFLFLTDGASRMAIDNAGNVGIGTNSPAAQLHSTGSVRFAGIACSGANLRTDGSGIVSCAVSSRQFKNITGDLSANVALANVMALRPQIGSYKETPDEPEHWLIAEDVAAVDPALAVFKNGTPFAIKTPNIVADLVAVVQQQQRRIDELEQRLSAK